MTKLPFLAAAAAVATAALLAGPALAGGAAKPKPKPKPKTVAFSASYTGKAVVRISGSNADIMADATGTGTPVGKSKLSGKGAGKAVEPCPLWGGTGTITAADGGKINFTIAPTGGSACGDEEAQTFSITGRATVTGGTGKYAKAKGSLKFTGTYERANGLFSVKFAGTLTI